MVNPSPTGQGGAGGKDRLRLWFRLLRTARLIEADIRERLRREYETTLPRFDVMAALYRAPEGMLMSDLSRFLLVSNGNVTGIVERLVAEGLVTRSWRNGDRRTSMVRLTEAGAARFGAIAAAHERWVEEALQDVGPGDATRLVAILDNVRSRQEDQGGHGTTSTVRR